MDFDVRGQIAGRQFRMARRAATSCSKWPPCGYATEMHRTPSRAAATASSTLIASEIDGGMRTAVRVPNVSRSTTSPCRASSPQRASTSRQAASDSASGTSLQYGRLYEIPPPSNEVMPDATVTSNSSRASGVPCRISSGAATASLSSRPLTQPWVTSG